MAEMADNAMNLWPNPNDGQELFITMAGLDMDIHTASVDLMDITGRNVMSTTLPVSNGQLNAAMELNNAANGSYLLVVTAGNKTFSKRVVVSK